MLNDRLQGEAEISVEGRDLAALLRQCEERDIPLKNVRFQENALKLTLPASALGDFCRIAEECGCFTEVQCFHGGIHFLKQGYHHRIFFGLVGISVIALLLVLSSVWHCEIRTEQGNYLAHAEEQQVLNIIKQTGICFPTWKRQLDYDGLATVLTEKCPEFAFVEVHSEGLCLKITAVKKDQGKIDTDVCRNVVAKKDGVVRSIFVLRGQQKVAVGETVARGQLLVSGTIAYEEEGKETVFSQTSAKGIVTASVWYEGVAFVSMREVKPKETGKTAGYIEVISGDTAHLLWGERQDPFEDSYIYEQDFSLKGKQIKFVTYRETKSEEIRYTPKEALLKAKKQAIKAAKAGIPEDAEIVGIDCTVLTAAAGAVGIRAVAETTEDIGMTRKANTE